MNNETIGRIKKQAELIETLADRVNGDIGTHCEARKDYPYYSLPRGYKKCSQCGEIVKYRYSLYGAHNFCNYCGCRMDIWDECYCAHGEKRIIEPQPDSIQVRTVDDLGRICIPKDIRDKLGIKPGTECAVYSTDELTLDEIIVIRRNKNDKH